ncbi:hypothetical protein MAJ_10608, partial [Metarhizium majus ARSEF 297]
MQIRFLFLVLLYHTTRVWAGGLQGCMERVLAFQAYEIDGLNPQEIRSIGVSCSRWDHTAKKCVGTWNTCKGSRPGGRCTYDEFLQPLKNMPTPKGWAVYQTGTTRLDAERTAQLCFQRYTNAPGNRGVRNFQSFNVIRNEKGEFNAYVERMGQIVDDAYANHRTNDNKDLFTDFDATRDRIAVLRMADHHRSLIPAMKTYFDQDLEIHIQDLGVDPARPGERLEVVDFKTTVLAAKSTPARHEGEANVERRIRFFLDGFYRREVGSGEEMKNSKVAREHLTLNKTYRKVADRARSCRG